MAITTGEDHLPRLGIAINLNQLRDLMREFVSEVEQDPDLQVQLNWTFETFLQWLRQRQRESVAEESDDNSIRS